MQQLPPPPPASHDQIDIKSGEHVVDCHTPSSGERLTAVHGPGLENVEEPEKTEERNCNRPVMDEEFRRAGQRGTTQRQPRCKTNGNGDNLVHHDRRRIRFTQNPLPRAANPHRKPNARENSTAQHPPASCRQEQSKKSQPDHRSKRAGRKRSAPRAKTLSQPEHQLLSVSGTARALSHSSPK